jgi:hypothetical protein
MAAATTIPETVTVPGLLVYDALVELEAMEEALVRMGDRTFPSGPLGQQLGNRLTALFGAAFGEWFVDEDLNEAPLATRVQPDSLRLLITYPELEGRGV